MYLSSDTSLPVDYQFFSSYYIYIYIPAVVFLVIDARDVLYCLFNFHQYNCPCAVQNKFKNIVAKYSKTHTSKKIFLKIFNVLNP